MTWLVLFMFDSTLVSQIMTECFPSQESPDIMIWTSTLTDNNPFSRLGLFSQRWKPNSPFFSLVENFSAIFRFCLTLSLDFSTLGNHPFSDNFWTTSWLSLKTGGTLKGAVSRWDYRIPILIVCLFFGPSNSSPFQIQQKYLVREKLAWRRTITFIMTTVSLP